MGSVVIVLITSASRWYVKGQVVRRVLSPADIRTGDVQRWVACLGVNLHMLIYLPNFC